MTRPYKCRTKPFHNFVDMRDEECCWEWTGHKDRQGYGQIAMNKKTHKAHRLAWEMNNGPIPVGMCVLHKCDNPSCVNPNHLFLGTRKDNAIDKMNKGRCLFGEKHCLVKITEEQAVAIINDPRLNIDIAKDYGISNQQVSRIKTGKRWRHLGSR